LVAAALLVAANSLAAQAPADLDGSFAFMETTSAYPSGATIYFSDDGTFYAISQSALEPGPQSGLYYFPSQKGTYVYQPSSGIPYQANLTLSYDGGSQLSETLDFAPNRSALSADRFYRFSFFFPTTEGQLLNVSNRALLRAGDTAIAGFVIGGTAPRPVLIRAVGPSLANFGVSPVAKAPQFSLFQGTGTVALAASYPWNPQDNTELGGAAGPYAYDSQAMGWIFGIIGAFALDSSANEQVFFGFVAPGVYTVQTSDPSATATGGWELTEVYVFPDSG